MNITIRLVDNIGSTHNRSEAISSLLPSLQFAYLLVGHKLQWIFISYIRQLSQYVTQIERNLELFEVFLSFMKYKLMFCRARRYY